MPCWKSIRPERELREVSQPFCLKMGGLTPEEIDALGSKVAKLKIWEDTNSESSQVERELSLK